MIFSNRLYDILEQDERFVPMLTRNSDVYVSLSKRVLYALDTNADVFLSLHCNASIDPKPNDCQIYYCSIPKDKPLAEHLFHHVDKIDHDTSKWSREIYGNFFVLRKLKLDAVAAVLVEIGFITNKEDEDMLNDLDFQDKFCRGLYNGIKAYFNV